MRRALQELLTILLRGGSASKFCQLPCVASVLDSRPTHLLWLWLKDKIARVAAVQDGIVDCDIFAELTGDRRSRFLVFGRLGRYQQHANRASLITPLRQEMSCSKAPLLPNLFSALSPRRPASGKSIDPHCVRNNNGSHQTELEPKNQGHCSRWCNLDRPRVQRPKIKPTSNPRSPTQPFGAMDAMFVAQTSQAQRLR